MNTFVQKVLRCEYLQSPSSCCYIYGNELTSLKIFSSCMFSTLLRSGSICVLSVELATTNTQSSSNSISGQNIISSSPMSSSQIGSEQWGSAISVLLSAIAYFLLLLYYLNVRMALLSLFWASRCNTTFSIEVVRIWVYWFMGLVINGS